jgi:hypothetical protein
VQDPTISPQANVPAQEYACFEIVIVITRKINAMIAYLNIVIKT